jgi:hypothetical protein
LKVARGAFGYIFPLRPNPTTFEFTYKYNKERHKRLLPPPPKKKKPNTLIPDLQFQISTSELLMARVHELEATVAAQQKLLNSMCFACQKRLLKK